MSDLPASVPFADVKAALGSLGIPVDHLMSVIFDAKRITVEQLRVDGDGRYLVAGDEVVTVTTMIGYDR